MKLKASLDYMRLKKQTTKKKRVKHFHVVEKANQPNSLAMHLQITRSLIFNKQRNNSQEKDDHNEAGDLVVKHLLFSIPWAIHNFSRDLSPPYDL